MRLQKECISLSERNYMLRAFLWSALGTTVIPAVASAQNPVTIAILPFDDRGSYGQDKEVFRALEVGIPATLGAELGRHPRVRVIERARVDAALKAEQLGPNARVDAATAARVGTQAGAQYAVTGNFADFYGKFRIDARVVDVGTGQILKVVSNSAPELQDRAELSRIMQDLAGKILNAAGLQPSAGSRSPQSRAVPAEAVTQYSLGLLYEEEGNRAKAAEHYQRALTAFPSYPEARDGMQRLR
jgi:TolB-like protein